MGIAVLQVDAFADRPFSGNPAAVVLPGGPAGDAWMQAVAAEMNLSATAFVHRSGSGWDLRWFSPVTELELCGHATLASAHALWELGWLALSEQARFQTRSGLLTCNWNGTAIELDLPAIPSSGVAPPDALVKGLGTLPLQVLDSGSQYYVAELGSDAAVRGTDPDLEVLVALDRKAVVVTAACDWPGYDIVSRVFAPQVGIPEDPVTGSAYCVLGPHWAARLGRDQLVAYQASPRGGALRVHVMGPRVRLIGCAVTVWRGELA